MTQEPDASGGIPEAVPVDTGRAFAELYQRSYRPMVRLAFLLTGCEEAAQDVVQDAFVRVHGRWTHVEHPDAYLRQAVVNGCRSTHRKIGRERSGRARQAPPDLVDLDADELFDALAALPFRQRAAVILRYYADLPEAEIATALGCRPGTVGSLLHRAVEQLRKVIEP